MSGEIKYGSLENPKTDQRPQKGAWAPGDYMCRCMTCQAYFHGDKRAHSCADCAYKLPAVLLDEIQEINPLPKSNLSYQEAMKLLSGKPLPKFKA